MTDLQKLYDSLVGDDGAKFDVNVKLGKQTILELFGIVLSAILIGMILNVALQKLIK